MKIIANIARILVGIEFIFSGFVKVVDPYGTGLKLQEYFEVFAGDVPALSQLFEFLASQSQTLSLVFCASELILGVALLFNFKVSKVIWIVLGLMVFFTFLTFYSAFFNKVTDCGCFGDFLKLKPWDSFTKDIISLFVILIIFAYRKNFKDSSLGTPMTLIATILAFGIGIYGLTYLPILDFLPYAAGKSIPDQMKPTGVKPELNYKFLDKSKNEEIESAEYLMDTLKYKYLSSEILNEELLRSKITDFAITDTAGNDLTTTAFEGKKLLLIFKYIDGIDENELSRMITTSKKVSKKGIEPMILTSVVFQDFEKFHKKHKLSFPYFATDEKVLKTMARTNPCLILLENGVVIKKWSINNIPSSEKVLDLLTKK
ncbi:DoxX family protein [Emticicia sp. CRIBPO]|uniref:BT_3928 family protein n=1 Tax=Emticicia sp. CRIBPO TaxID=2683258 RepID=UPI001412B721|nr:BT_3928 family protein [Emticicia sp. CRIBPO]NBA88699.1 DoxX family protein [Emticicia sp. CRIBPO]